VFKRLVLVSIFIIGIAYSQEVVREINPENSESVEIVWSDDTINQSSTSLATAPVFSENRNILPVNDNAAGIDPVNPPSAEFLDNASSGTYTTCTCCMILLVVYLITALI